MNVDWEHEAACGDHDPEWWFPQVGNGATYARRVCVQDCPVRRQCAESRRDMGHGVIAGFALPKQRPALVNWLDAHGGNLTNPDKLPARPISSDGRVDL